MTTAGTGVAVRPHIITAPIQYGRVRYYVRSAHAADIYYRVESSYGWLSCTCPAGQRRTACEHLTVAMGRAMQ